MFVNKNTYIKNIETTKLGFKDIIISYIIFVLSNNIMK